MSIRKNTCESCCFADKRPLGIICKRFPQTVEVYPSNWCGEFKAKQAKLAMLHKHEWAGPCSQLWCETCGRSYTLATGHAQLPSDQKRWIHNGKLYARGEFVHDDGCAYAALIRDYQT